MGRNISHGTNPNGEMRRSASTIHNLGQHIAHVLPAAEWRRIKYLFDDHAYELAIAPADAVVAAQVIRTAANHSLMPAEWAADAHELANAAECAARSGQTWEWY